jgi:RNA polymerase sigma-70 factor, ECF subfamily
MLAADQKSSALLPFIGVNAGLAAHASDLTFADIFRTQARYLWRALLGLGVRPADADDVCQEVLLIVHRRLPEFDGRALRSWLYAICLRVASEYRRSARIRRELSVAEVPDTVVAERQLHDVVAREVWEDLLVALEELDEDKRATFVLYEIEELSLREVAEATGCPLQTAYSRLQAARNQVRERFDRRSGT